MVLLDKIILTEDRDTTHGIKETLKDSTTINFGTKRHISFRWKKLDNFAPLIHKRLAHGNFLKLSTELFPFRNLMVLRDRIILTEDRDITHEIRETIKDTTTKIFGTKTNLNFRRKKPDTPPSYPRTFSLMEIFLKYSTEWFPYEVFRYCETTNYL